MNKLFVIASLLSLVFSFSSCKEGDPVPMTWEVCDYDQEEVSAVCTPGYVYGVEISASADYNGDITVKCTNYPELLINANNYDGTYTGEKAGLTVSKIDDNTLKFTLEPITEMDEEAIYDVVLVEGRNSKESYISNILVERKKITTPSHIIQPQK